jgi:Gluconate 2-dehydrogenase subunit 3
MIPHSIAISRRHLLAAFTALGLAPVTSLLGERGITLAPPAPLSSSDRILVASLAETILPTTDTPGAIAAGVPEFIEFMYAEWLLPEEQHQFIEGLRFYRNQAIERFAGEFALLSTTQQLALAEAWDREAAAAKGGTHPFALFRALTIVGYYTSQIGQEAELKLSMEAGIDDPRGPRSPLLPVMIR